MRLPALLLLAALALSGCLGGDDHGAAGDPSGDGPDAPDDGAGTPDDGGPGGDQADPDDGGEGGAGGDESNATEPRDPVTWRITIRGNDFVDGSLTVQAGDTVVWTHQDGTTPHTVTADDGAFDSGSSPAQYMTEVNNAEFSHTFDEVGEFPYHCAVHPSMRDTVTVLERHDATP